MFNLSLTLSIVLFLLIFFMIPSCNEEPVDLTTNTLIKYTLQTNKTDVFDLYSGLQLDEADRSMISSVNVNLYYVESSTPLNTFGRFHGFTRTINPSALKPPIDTSNIQYNEDGSEAFIELDYPVFQGKFESRIASTSEDDEDVLITTQKKFFTDIHAACSMNYTSDLGWMLSGIKPILYHSTNSTGSYLPPIVIESIGITISKIISEEIQHVDITLDETTEANELPRYIVSYIYEDENGESQSMETDYIDVSSDSTNPLMNLTLGDKIRISAIVVNTIPCTVNEATCVVDSPSSWYRNSNSGVFLHTNGLEFFVSDEFNNPDNLDGLGSQKSRFQMRNDVMKIGPTIENPTPPLPDSSWELGGAQISKISKLDDKRYRVRDYIYIEAIDSKSLNDFNSENNYQQMGIALPVWVRFLSY